MSHMDFCPGWGGPRSANESCSVPPNLSGVKVRQLFLEWSNLKIRPAALALLSHANIALLSKLRGSCVARQFASKKLHYDVGQHCVVPAYWNLSLTSS